MLLMVNSAVSILYVDKVCLGNAGPSLVFGLTNNFSLVIGYVTSALILTTMSLTSLVLLELRRMLRRVCPPSMVERDTEVLNATKYLITYMVTMVISLTPLNTVHVLLVLSRRLEGKDIKSNVECDHFINGLPWNT